MKKYIFGLLIVAATVVMVSFTNRPVADRSPAKALVTYGYFHFTGTSTSQENNPAYWEFIAYDNDGSYDCSDTELLCTMKAPVTGSPGNEVIDVASLASYPTVNFRSDATVSEKTFQP